MARRTWLITGVSSGFGRELTQQLLARGDLVVGTVRDTAKVKDLVDRHGDAFRAEILDVTDTTAVHTVVNNAFAALGRIESVAQEVAGFGIGMTIVEPGGARTEFRYGSAQVATLMDVYDATPAHAFRAMLDPANGLAPGDPARMAARIIDSVEVEPAPLRIILGSQALDSTLSTLRTRIEGFERQRDLAASTDYPGPEQAVPPAQSRAARPGLTHRPVAGAEKQP